MSSPRNSGSAGRYGGDSDYGKRRKNYYAASTRRDFKSSAAASSASASASASAPALSAGPNQSAPAKPSLRGDTSQNSEYSRARFRDSVSAASSSSPSGSRGSTYSKDSRYGSYGSKYAYSANYYQDRPSGAYGSFSSAKRAENEPYGGHASSRDASSRDMVSTSNNNSNTNNNSSNNNSNSGSARQERPAFSRDAWRTERPKPHPSGGAKAPAAARFNPNSIPVHSRSGSNGLSSSVSHDYKKERHEAAEEANSGSGRWKSFSSPRADRVLPSGPNARFSSPKERIRSSGLTNSVGSSKRSDSYYPKTPRFGGRYARESYDTGAPGASRYGSGAPGSREYNAGTRVNSNSNVNSNFNSSNRINPNAKSVSPTSGSAYDTIASTDSARVSATQNSAYRDDEVDEDDEEEDDDDDEDDEDDDDEDDEDEYEETINVVEDAVNVSGNKPLAATDADNALPAAEKISAPASSVKTETEISQESSEKSSTLIDAPLSAESSLDTSTSAEYPEGCAFPQTQLEAAYDQLKLGLADDKAYHERAAPYVRLDIEFSSLPFFSYNLKRFASLYEHQLQIVKSTKRALKKKQLALVRDYQAMASESEKRREYMEEQLKVIHPADDEGRKELEAIDIRVKVPEPEPEAATLENAPPAGRRGRRHGDSVTTEAEFEEILKSLKNESNEDPVARAQHVAATIPDLILDPIEREAFKFMDSNNFVQDRTKWEERLSTDFETNFTEIEHDLFCDAFCRFPKRFGEISRYMGGLRTFNECVLHYYITKKAVNYKFLVSQFKKKSSKKSGARKKKAKVKAVQEDVGVDAALVSVTSANDGEIQQSAVVENQIEAKVEEIAVPVIAASKHPASASETEEPARKKSRAETTFPSGISATSESHVKGEVYADPNSAEKQVVSPEEPAVPSVPVVQSDRELAGDHANDEKKNAKHITSYWSITEVEEFPHLLSRYGSSWGDIAEQLGAKSATMVRNYYQRNARKFGWDSLVANIDMRRGQFPPNNQPTVSIANGYDSSLQGMQMAPAGAHFGASVSVEQSYGANVNGIVGVAAPNSHQSFPEKQLSHLSAVEAMQETHKSSIRNLLNSDASPQKPEHFHSTAAPRRNNLSSLLNAPSSPVADSAPATSNDANSAKRANIESLLG